MRAKRTPQLKKYSHVRAAINLHRSGVRVSAGDTGTVLESIAGKIVRHKTGFGTVKTVTAERVKVLWTSGEEGWHDREVLEEGDE